MLTEGHGRPVTHFEFDQTSPPVVFEDLVIVGSRVPDGVQRRFDPPGTVQAFDVCTGERRWVFFTIPAVGRPLRRGHLGGRVPALHRTNGREIDAVAQVSKHGFTFVFDRVTGEPRTALSPWRVT